MLDPETLVVKGGIIVLASVTMLRMILHEIRNVKEEFTAKRKRR